MRIPIKRNTAYRIYQNPLTEKIFEGLAFALRRLKIEENGLEMWRVRFLSDNTVVDRFIKVVVY